MWSDIMSLHSVEILVDKPCGKTDWKYLKKILSIAAPLSSIADSEPISAVK